MSPDEVEQMLYDHAIRSTARPPVGERIVNFLSSRVFKSGLVAGSALVCTVLMSVPVGTTASHTDSQQAGKSPSQFTDTNNDKSPSLQLDAPFQHDTDPVTTPSLALSPLGN
jgi:hypothetical protein